MAATHLLPCPGQQAVEVVELRRFERPVRQVPCSDGCPVHQDERWPRPETWYTNGPVELYDCFPKLTQQSADYIAPNWEGIGSMVVGRIGSCPVSAALITLALLVAIVSVPTVAGLTAWGLAGGDGETKNAFVGLLAMIVGFGSIYNVVNCYTAYFLDLPPWRWWLMLLPPAAGLLGLLAHGDEPEDTTVTDRLVGIVLQLVLAVPAALLLASDAVTTG